MGVLEAQPFGREQQPAAGLGVDSGKYRVDQPLIADDARFSLPRAQPRHERDRREPIAQREQRLVDPSIGLGLVDADDPGRVGVLLRHPQRRPGKRLVPPVRVRARRANPEPHTLLPHQIGHVKLRRTAHLEAGEVRVLWRRDDPAPRREGDRHTVPPLGHVGS